MKTLKLNRMEGIEGGMPCGVAIGLYATAFIGLAMATGGASIAVAAVGFGGSIWGVFDSCD
jgi:hypothetical protein